MRISLILLLSTALMAQVVRGSALSTGHKGINYTGYKLPDGTLLDGSGVGLGQVEMSRAGKPDFDTVPEDHNDAVKPFKVLVHGQNAQVGASIHYFDGHAEHVASVMIADGTLGKKGDRSINYMDQSPFLPLPPPFSPPYGDVTQISEKKLRIYNYAISAGRCTASRAVSLQT